MSRDGTPIRKPLPDDKDNQGEAQRKKKKKKKRKKRPYKG